MADVPPNEALAAEYVDRGPCHTSVQVGPEFSEHEANTQQILHRSTGMLHTEGGWPKDVDSTEAEHVIRFRRKVEKDEDYIRSIVSLGCQVRNTVSRAVVLVDLISVTSGGIAHQTKQRHRHLRRLFCWCIGRPQQRAAVRAHADRLQGPVNRETQRLLHFLVPRRCGHPENACLFSVTCCVASQPRARARLRLRTRSCASNSSPRECRAARTFGT